MRMQGMIQETAGHTVVAAAQRMWRSGMTETAQLEFIQSLGQIRAATILKKQAALSRREEALGWTAVGRILALKQFSGHTQERLGSAVRDAGVLSAMIKSGTPMAQESLGSAILMASAAQSAISTGNVPSIPGVSTPGVAGRQAPPGHPPSPRRP